MELDSKIGVVTTPSPRRHKVPSILCTSPNGGFVAESPKEQELSTSLSNLKWGFKRREEKLQEQLAIHKEALAELYQLHLTLKEKLNEAGTATCVHLEEAENLSALCEENEQQRVQQQLSFAAFTSKLKTLEIEKNKLEASNQTLQLQLQELQQSLNSSKAVHSTPVESEPQAQCVISSIANVVQAAYVSTETFKPSEGIATEDSGKVKKETVLLQSPLRLNKRATAASTHRRHSLDSTPTKPTTSGDLVSSSAASSDRRSSFPRKGATPKLETSKSTINTVKSPVKQSAKPPTKDYLRRKLPTVDQTDIISSVTSPVPAKEKIVTPRIPLRQRIEAHSQQLRSRDHNLNHNAWVGGFTTTNRQSGGGVQFFVDVLTQAPRDQSGNKSGTDDIEVINEGGVENAGQAVSDTMVDEVQDSCVTQIHPADGNITSNTTNTFSIHNDSGNKAPIVLTLLPPTEIAAVQTHDTNLHNTRKSAHSLAEMQLLQSDLNTEPEEEEVSILYTPVTNIDNNGKHGVHLSVLDAVPVGTALAISQGIAMVTSTDSICADEDVIDTVVPAVQNRKSSKLERTASSLSIDTSISASDAAQPVSPAPSSSNKYLLLEVQMYKRQVVELKKQLAEMDVPVKVETEAKKVSNVATQVTEASLFVLETAPHMTSADHKAATVPPKSTVDTAYSKDTHVLQIGNTPVRTLLELAAVTPIAENTLQTINLGADFLATADTTGENANIVDIMVEDNADMFVELCDASTQCMPDVSTEDAACNTGPIYVPHTGTATTKDVVGVMTPAGCDASTQSEFITAPVTVIGTTNQSTTTNPISTVHASTSTPPPPTTVDIGTTVCTQSTRDALLFSAIEASKFELGKKLFKLRMEERKIAKRNRKDQRNTQQHGSKEEVVTTNTNSTNTFLSTLPSVTTVNTAAVSRANEQAKLNAELIVSLQEKATRHQRDQRKIELLEQKLCRLIMYVKKTNKQKNTINNCVPKTDHAATLANVAQEVVKSKSISPPTNLPQVSIKPAPRVPPQSNKPTKKAVKVGEMSFHGDLSHLLCIDNNDSETSSDEENEPTMELSNTISDVTDLFSPPRDFEGRYYDETSDLNVTTRSNPLLHRTITSPEYITSKNNNMHTKDPHNESDLDYGDVYQNNSIVDTSFGHDMSAFDVPQMASLSNNKADLFSPIPHKRASRTTSINSVNVSSTRRDNEPIKAVQMELMESQNKFNKLQQHTEYLEMRNKSLLRDKELLVNKLKRTFETDTASFGLKIFSSEHNETYSLENPTVTASIVMGFIDNNNKLLDKIGVLTASLEEKIRQQEKQAQLRAEADAELTQALAQKRHLSAEVSSLHTVVLNITQDRDELQRQVSQLTGTLVHMAQENKVLKDKLRMHTF